jgi:hypothetical protein
MKDTPKCGQDLVYFTPSTAYIQVQILYNLRIYLQLWLRNNKMKCLRIYLQFWLRINKMKWWRILNLNNMNFFKIVAC